MLNLHVNMTNLQVIEERLRDAEALRDAEGDIFNAFIKATGIDSVNLLANLSANLTGEKLAYVCELKNISAHEFHEIVSDFFEDMADRCEPDSLVACAFLGVTMALTILYTYNPDETTIYNTLASALKCYDEIVSYANRHDYRDEKEVTASFNLADSIAKNKKVIVALCNQWSAYGNFKCCVDTNKWKSIQCMNFAKAMFDVLYESVKKGGGDLSAVVNNGGIANMLYRLLANTTVFADPFKDGELERAMLGVTFAYMSLFSITR